MIYKGGANLELSVTITNGSVIPFQVYVSEFSGTIRVSLPHPTKNDMFSAAFLRDPGITFRVDSQLTLQNNEMLRGIINQVLSGVIRRVFLDLWVLPSQRGFYIPFMEPRTDVLSFEFRFLKPTQHLYQKVNPAI